MLGTYTLDGKTPVQCEDPIEWATWFENAQRHVAKNTIYGLYVSTVFLGLDHSFMPGGRPILFETMVFSGKSRHDIHQERYSTWEEAEAGHARLVKEIRRNPWKWAIWPSIEMLIGSFKRLVRNLVRKMKG